MENTYVNKIKTSIAREIIELMKSDSTKWIKQWSETSHPQNATTGFKYSGANIWATTLTMWRLDANDPRFITYNQAKLLGGTIPKGTKSTPIFFFSRNEKTTDEKEGYVFAKIYNSFNVTEVEGIDPDLLAPLVENKGPGANQDQKIEDWVAKTGVNIHNDSHRGAYYRPSDDSICMPAKARFLGQQDHATVNYYSTLLHELVHWTGSKDRLDRQTLADYFTDKSVRAKEELTAEIGAALLCRQHGLSSEVRPDHAAYIKSWIKNLSDSPYELFRSTAAAQRSVDFLNKLQILSKPEEAYPCHIPNKVLDTNAATRQLMLQTS
jgi:antirestriction protein ArdC